MKQVILIAKYHAYVPEDMTVSQIQDLAEEIVRDKMEYFQIYVEDYHEKKNYENGHEVEPLFALDDVMVGTEAMISIGGD